MSSDDKRKADAELTSSSKRMKTFVKPKRGKRITETAQKQITETVQELEHLQKDMETIAKTDLQEKECKAHETSYASTPKRLTLLYFIP